MHVYSTLVDVLPAPLDHFELKGISIAFELWIGEWDIRDCEAFKIPVSELLMRPDEMTALTQRASETPMGSGDNRLDEAIMCCLR